MGEDMLPLLLHAFMACKGKTLPLTSPLLVTANSSAYSYKEQLEVLPLLKIQNVKEISVCISYRHAPVSAR
jgi:hypothetical protein